MMGVLNFAHASFYMLGAYFAYALTGPCWFLGALVVAPIAGAALARGGGALLPAPSAQLRPRA